MSWFKRVKLSKQIDHGSIIENKKLKLRARVTVRQDAPFCHTWIIESDCFKLEIRMPNLFDKMFKGWTLEKG